MKTVRAASCLLVSIVVLFFLSEEDVIGKESIIKRKWKTSKSGQTSSMKKVAIVPEKPLKTKVEADLEKKVKKKAETVGKTLTSLYEVTQEKHPEEVDMIFISRISLSDVLSGVTFAKFSNLRYLMLTNTDIHTLPADLCKGLPNLIQLDLAGNAITDLPSSLLHGSPNLEIVNFEGNNITSIPADFFSKTPQVSYINFAYNGLTTLPKDVFSSVPDLGMLLLYNNSIRGFTRQDYGLDRPNLNLIYGSQWGNSKNPYQYQGAPGLV